MDDDALFEVPEGARVDVPPVTQTATALAYRQLEKLRRRLHPLSKPGQPIPLHPDAPAAEGRLMDLSDPGPRCGTCAFRELVLAGGYNGKRVPKCLLPDARGRRTRLAHSAESDVRSWWPACRDYQAGTSEAA